MASKWTQIITPHITKIAASEAAAAVKPVTDELDKNVSKGIGDRVGKTVKAASVASLAVGGAVTATMVSAVKSAGDLQQSLGGLDAVFESQGNTMKKWSLNAANTMGITQNEAAEVANKMGSLFQGTGFTAEQSAKMTREMATRAADVASVMGVDLSMAMESVTGAAKGNFTMMDNLGVAMNETTIKAYAISSGMVKAAVDTTKLSKAQLNLEKAESKHAEAVKKHGKDSIQAREAALGVASAQDSIKKAMEGSNVELTAQQKSQAAYNLFLDKTSKYAGNYVKENTTLNGSMEILRANVENAKASLGVALIPVLTKLTEFVQTSVIPILTQFTNWMRENPEKAELLAKSIAAVGVTLVALGTAGLALGPIITSLKTALVVAKGAMAAFNLVISMNPIGLIVIAIAALIAGLVLAYKKSETFRAIVDKVWSFIKTVVIATIKGIVAYFKFYYNTYKGIWDLIKTVTTGALNFIKEIPEKIKGFFTGSKGWLLNAGKDIIQGLLDGLKIMLKIYIAYINFIIDTVLEIKDKIVDTFRGAKDWLADSGLAMIKGFIKGINRGFDKAKDVVKDGLKEVRDFFPFSPAKVGPFSGMGYTIYSGQALMADFGKGISIGANDSITQMSKAMDAIAGHSTGPKIGYNDTMAASKVINYQQIIQTPAPESTVDIFLTNRRAAFSALGGL